MFRWLYLVVIAIAVIPYSSCDLLCGDVNWKNTAFLNWNMPTCYCNSSTSSAKFDYNKYRESVTNQLSMTVNRTTGEGVVRFPLPQNRCHFMTFEVELRLANVSDATACENFSPNNHLETTPPEDIFQMHSIRYLNTTVTDKIEDHKSEMCQEFAEVHFFYIFTGCYFVVVSPRESNSKKRQAEMRPQYFVSDITKKEVELMGRNVTIAPHFYPATGTLVPRFSLRLPTSSKASSGPMLVALELRSNVDLKRDYACTRASSEHECCMMRESVSKGVCTSNPDKEVNHCSTKNNIIECTFYNITPGNYCVLMQVKDDRCETSTLWSLGKTSEELSCLWSSHFEALLDNIDPDVGVERVSARWHLWVVLAAVVSAIVVCLMYGLYILVTISRRTMEDDPDGSGMRDIIPDDDFSQSPLMQRKEQKILLLYARDCAPFMNLMEVLRFSLQKYCKCEVLDVYDEEYQKEIFTREQDWLLEHLRQIGPELKVVLVATECAAAHQLAQCGVRNPVEYVDPDPCDKLFPLALKLLKSDVNPGLYSRVKLVEFSGFIVEKESPNLFPNPYTRYVLPSDFNELVCAIRKLNNKKHMNLCEDDLKEMRSLLDDLLQYKKDNPSYLSCIITN